MIKLAPCLTLSAIFLVAGCTTTRTSNTSRTGMEQLLISNSIDQAIAKTPIPKVDGRKVFLDPQYLDCVDKGYVLASVRHKLLSQGGLLVDKKDDSDITVELRSGGLGTDNVNSFVGMPNISMPGPLPMELPEVRLWERTSQYGTAKIGLVAYESKSGSLLFDSGRQLSRSDDSRWSLLGVGPFQSGSVRDEVAAGTGTTDFAARAASASEPRKSMR